MSAAWLRLPVALSKLVGRSPHSNVVSGAPTISEAQEATPWNRVLRLHNGDVENQKQEASAQEILAARNDHGLHESRVQQTLEGARQPPGSVSILSRSIPAPSAQQGNSFPVQSQHRRASSAGSEVSVSSIVSTTGATTGAYTGFTQHGQYDLTHDIILRGEFISDQQAKA